MNLHVVKQFFVVSIVLMMLVGTASTENRSVNLKSLLYKCTQSSMNVKEHRMDFFDILRSCLQRRALITIDALLSSDIITIYNGLDLVRYKEDKNTTDNQHGTNRMNNARDSGKTWREIVFGRVAQIFKTHVLKIDIDRLTDRTISILQVTRDNTSDMIVEGRRRHHRRRSSVMPMLMMGVMLMGTVLIPMGFQFLAVLGGKALVLAKLALMLSSIQGLKKVATNGYNYGLYHTPVSEGWHDRSHNEQINNYHEIPYQIYPRTDYTKTIYN